MNRRELLKMLPLAGLVPVATGRSLWTSSDQHASYFVVTARPAADLDRLLRLIGVDRADADVATRAMQPAAQDVSLLRAGTLVDPSQTGGDLAAFAAELRHRRQAGSTLLSVEPRKAAPRGVVVIEQGGRVFDQVRADRDYDRIEVPGTMGPTVFRLRGGRLSVVTSSCRHELCRKTGAHADGRIICAPNRLVATLPRAARHGLDAVTG